MMSQKDNGTYIISRSNTQFKHLIDVGMNGYQKDSTNWCFGRYKLLLGVSLILLFIWLSSKGCLLSQPISLMLYLVNSLYGLA